MFNAEATTDSYIAVDFRLNIDHVDHTFNHEKEVCMMVETLPSGLKCFSQPGNL